MRRKAGRLGKAAGALALLVGSLVVSLLIAEVIVRIAIPYEEVFLANHPVLGFAHPPGRSGNWMRERTSPLRVTINSKGLRDREFDYPKPPGVKRILMMGDSMVEGFQVELEENESDFHEPSLLPGNKGLIFVVHRRNEPPDRLELLAGKLCTPHQCPN